MTTERLEELAQWAHDQSVEQDIDGSSVRAAYLRDLARCARAWAKVESLRLSRLDINHVTCTYLFVRADGNKDYCNGPTSIEAVEAAEVGK